MIKGSHHSKEAKRKMSEGKKGKHYSPKTEFKRGSKINLGRKHSEDWRKKVSKGWFKKGSVPWSKGKEMSVETKRKLSKALKGRKAWNKGKEMPEEIKNKLRGLSKGRHFSPRTEFKKGQNKGDENPARRPEVRRKISKAKKGKPLFNLRGKNHPRWRGQSASINERFRRRIEYRLWREAVFNRDNWTCQKCGKRGGKINIHHLHNFADYPDLRISIENGIALCKKCHIEFHKIYGVKNNTKEKFKDFLNILRHNEKNRNQIMSNKYIVIKKYDYHRC
ncbi:HNH endonuclease [Patescibacteria group bacterium]|nr:HNH endonuclease [Patescibacteria group bacterium]